MGPQVLSWASLVRPKRPTILSQPTNKISLLYGTWRNLLLTADIKKLQKSLYLVDFSPIYGPPGARMGLPGSSKTAYNIRSTHQQNFTSLWDMAELTFDCWDEKTAKKPKFGAFWPYFRTLQWLVRPSLFIEICPISRARALTILLFI